MQFLLLRQIGVGNRRMASTHDSSIQIIDGISRVEPNKSLPVTLQLAAQALASINRHHEKSAARLLDAELTGAGEDGVFQIGGGFFLDRGIDPTAVRLAALLEQRHPQAIGPQVAI